MVFLGGFLVLFGTGLALVVPGLMARVPLNAELPISSTQLVLVLTLLAAFGLIGMMAGISMIRTGRTNRVLLSVAGMLLLAMFVWMQSTNQAASHRESAPAVWVR